MTPRPSRLTIWWIVVVAGCTHDIGAPVANTAPNSVPMVVSNATTIGPALATARTISASKIAYSPSRATATDEVTYVSLLPNSAPGGTSAVLTNVRTKSTLTASMVEGGLDPVPLLAAVGDTVHIDVLNAGGTAGPHFDRVVPGTRAPTVIRSIPSRGKTGVPLNKSIVIVFSEPVSASSLSSTTVELLRGTTPVSGSARILQGVTASVVFDATSPLEPNTEYQLVVTRGVRDLDGDALDSAVTIPFTTGTTTEGPPANLSLVPQFADVRVGDEVQLLLTVTDAQGNVITGKPVTWYFETFVAGPEVLRWTGPGVVLATSEGEAFIVAQVDNLLISGIVDVSNTLTDVKSVTLSLDTATIAPNDTFSVSVAAKDLDDNVLGYRVVHWSTTNAAVAIVRPSADARAIVTGVANGVAKIIATIDQTSDTLVVSVGPIPPAAGFVFTGDLDSLLVGQTEQLHAMSRNSAGGRAPLDAASAVWESSNPAVLSVDASGVLTAVGSGVATITGRWSGFSATSQFTVTQITLRSVSAGKAHTCGVATTGIVYCWGADAMGQLGRPGTVDFRLAVPGQIYYPFPVPAVNAMRFDSVSAGGLYTCGLASGSETAGAPAYCWGFNGDGALGNGTTFTNWRPANVLGGLTFTELHSGTTHACGLTSAGAAYCWGANAGGQLGVSGRTGSVTPLPVQGGLTFSSLAVGGTHNCGLTADGTAYCWGSNAAGQLGVGDNVASSSVPLPVSGGITFASISAGESHTCGLMPSGALYCWGWNLEGELGDGSGRALSAIPNRIAADHVFLAVSAGGLHTCAVDTAHDLYCWGLNANGQLGIGPSGPATAATPQRVVSALAFAKVSLGGAHSCAATADGVWYCWGQNDNGQLGIGNKGEASPLPLKVLGQP